jgi:hypothetical protein
MGELITDDFILALKDYYYLVNNAYPRAECLKLTGNRYQLNKMQRIILTRGIFRQDEADSRIKKKETTFVHRIIYVDGYNVLFTVGNYLLGRPVFISNDLFMRDAGEIGGKVNRGKAFSQAVELLVKWLSNFRENEYIILLDLPVPGSVEAGQMINRMLHEKSLKGEASAVVHPDDELIRIAEGMIATSDSEIIDETDNKVIDIAHEVLKAAFRPQYVDLTKLLKK